MLAQQIVNGLMLGSVYTLIGIGYTLVFGVLRMLNLAHAYVFMAAPFIVLGAVEAGVPPFVALALGLIGAALLGLVLYLLVFRPIPREHALGGFVASLSFGIVLQVIAVNRWGGLSKPFPAKLALPDWSIGNVILSGMQLASLGIAAVLMLALLYVIRRTRFGRNIRAIALNPTAAALLGVGVQRAVILVFLLSSGLAGLAGLLVAMRFESITPFMGDTYAIKALAIIIIGGLGDVRGAMLAGLLLGVCEVLFAAYGSPGWSEAFIWLFLIAVFLIKPSGIFGARVESREI
ncbi:MULTISPECIES: branched-chain amino acid ABC transporter permease [unclassified Caballeronia]|jgi:branched-chain amino acid transport system permease protein|uniref:branched-chain amino acid ABC transporter permease n=1 Tax=unclassified Caballeronia TaxID=2646786 RepID=UPI00286564C9|nr:MULTISPECIES: branched-chain amino acid ABC transporter permease [unclassified Caballeronia]MDR5758621.1 branched-chain amino acid ABC transporter permease [Caballeronia sp. LZ035]MDR5815257.1 branched-chain amino acid ABC transporter permease [Caballeronia sp. LZ033]MDR5822600.1 branched-chain amino acid ABC transporter permease [Caballeronia sp. LZ043]